MNKTLYTFIASILIVVFGFGSFYFFKIMPMRQQLSSVLQNTTMYRQLTETNKKNYEKKKLKNKLALTRQEDKEKKDKVSAVTLPNKPEIESFFVTFQNEAAKRGVTVVQVTKGGTASSDSVNDAVDASSNASGNSNSSGGAASSISGSSQNSGTAPGESSNTSNASSSSQTGSSSTDDQTKPTASSVLQANRYTVALTAPNQADIIRFIGYLESMKRLLVVNNYSMQLVQTTVDESSDDANSAISTDAVADTSSTSGSDDSPVDPAKSTDSDSTNGLSGTNDQPATISVAQATLTLTLYSQK